MFEKIVNKSFLIKVLYWLCLFLTFLFISYRLRYAILIYDDVIDLITSKFNFYHGRFYSEFCAFLLVNGIPTLFGINLQDFAIISENFVKSAVFVWLTVVVSNIFWIGKKKETIFSVLLYLFSFFTLWLLLLKEGDFILSTLQFYFGYILPLPIFLILWKRLGDIYITGGEPDSFENKILIVLSVLIAQSNELVCIVLFVLLVLLGIEKLIEYCKYKSLENYRWILYPFVALLLMSAIVYTNPGFKLIVDFYITPESFVVKTQDLFSFLRIFLDTFILKNMFVIITTIVLFVMLLCSKQNKEENKKVFKYSTYTWISVLTFFFSLFFVGKSCYYVTPNDENSYWILYQPLVFSFKVFLYTFALYILGYLFRNDEKFKMKIIVMLFLFLGMFLQVQGYFNRVNQNIYSYNLRKTMYQLDKLAVFYFLRGETAILPKDDLDKIYSIEKDGSTMPYDLKNDQYKNKIYYKSDDNNIWPYLQYLKHAYGIDNIEKGIKFTSLQEALSEYQKRGGYLTQKELKDLDFGKINKQIENYEETHKK